MAVPHFAFPFRVNGDHVAVVEQDTYNEVAQCVQIVLTTVRGSRIEVPTYGVRDLVFSVKKDQRTQDMLSSISKWEPRAQATLRIDADNVDDFIDHVVAEIPARVDDIQVQSLPLSEEISEGDESGYGVGGWGIQPWGA